MTSFGAKSTASEVAEGHDLKGYNVIVTGGNSGIGLETVRVLAQVGATVFMTARNVEKAKLIQEDLVKSTGNKNIHIEQLELDSLDNVKSFVQRFLEKNISLHILINNAGVMGIPLTYSRDGIEMQFATNHIGHFALTNGLLPALKAGAKDRNVRVVNVSSCAHGMTDILEDWNFKNTEYDTMMSYGQSKTANVLFTVGFNDRYSKDGIFSNALMPGVIITNIGQHLIKADPVGNKNFWDTVLAPHSKTIPEGTSTTIWAALSPDLEGKGGLYLEHCSISKQATKEEINSNFTGHLPYIYDKNSAEKLWKLSEELTNK